ncbi:hypothetical protein G9A89_009107 [Geosiphon pyriformis]|nr:hypothetical protein G9A89_009107 [Geosiphon pyriformis]
MEITQQTTNFKVATTPDTTTLEYYQSIYTHCKQRFNIPDEIEIVERTLYQYIENCINNYLLRNYNILKVKSNLYNNLVHYLRLGTKDLNKLNYNIIKYCEEKYPVQSKYSFDFESETETDNKDKQKVKQHSKNTPNIPILPKTIAKHLQTPEQETSIKLPLSITPFSISLARPQTLNSPLNHFSRPEEFQSPRNSTQQQKPISTSTNIIEYLQENKSDHSKNLESKETKSEQGEATENKEEMATAYIAKIPEFMSEDNNTTGLKDQLIKKVHPHAPADLATAIKHAKSNEMAMEEENYTKLVNLAIEKTSSAAKKKINQLTKKKSDFQQTALSEDEVAAPRSNPSNHTILPVQIAQNANLSDIFPFEFEANELPFLLNNAAVNKQKAITAMYTEATVKEKPICLILDSGLAGSIITYQLMQQLKQNINRPAQTVIVTADGMKKTPVGEIDDFPFTINGITISVKVLVIDASQY